MVEKDIISRDMANAIRFLSADAIEKSNLGIPECPWEWRMWQQFSLLKS